MNLLMHPELWTDYEGESPPIIWNPAESRYEILLVSEAGFGGNLLAGTAPASAGDVLSFDCVVDQYTLDIVDPSSLFLTGSVEGDVWQLVLDSEPVSGSADIECVEGSSYSFAVRRDSGFGQAVYAFEAIITPIGDGPVPDPELVANDDTAETVAGEPVVIDILANDTIDGAPVELAQLVGPPVIVDQPLNGAIVVNVDGTATYTPDDGFSGVDTGLYEIEIETGLAQAAITITVLEAACDTSYDCECEGGDRNTETLGTLTDRLLQRLGFIDPLGAVEVRTLADFRRALLIRNGYAANAANPPAGMHDLIDEIVNEEQQVIWRRLELDSEGAQPPRMAAPADENTLDYPLVFARALGMFKAHTGKQDAKLYLDEAEKMLGDYMKRSPPSVRRVARDFVRESQRFLFDKVASFRQSRFFRWPLEQGVRFYGFGSNTDECDRRFVPELVEGVYVTEAYGCPDERWRELIAGINPLLYNGGIRESWPQRYEFRQCIELFPAPDQREGYLRIKAKFDAQMFEEETDRTTIDADLVFLHALGLAKAHFGQPDAKEYASLVQSKIGDINAGSHHTRRYIPGADDWEAATPPRPRDGFIEN